MSMCAFRLHLICTVSLVFPSTAHHCYRYSALTHLFRPFLHSCPTVEFYQQPDRIPDDIIQRQAPILALVGDIGLAFTETLRYFLHQQADRFEHVLFLAGNHEFYNHGEQKRSVQEQLAWLQSVCDEKPNLHLLERQAVEIRGVLILGTTLWSYVPNTLASKAEGSMNDYHLSYIDDGNKNLHKMTAAFTNEWHRTSVAWLQQEIDQAATRAQPVVVLTHHTPSLKGTSDPRYEGSDLSHCFSTDLQHLLKDPVKVWACGHTHYNFQQHVDNGTKLVSNQRGYPGQERLDYDEEGLVIRVSPPKPTT